MMPQDPKRLRILLKDCADGFYQQMYFLGKDVIHPAGNQLIKYGFEKSASKGLKGTSCYSLDSNDQLIDLYGSCAGVYSGDSQLVYLRERCRFYHWLSDSPLVAGQWSQGDVSVGDAQDIFTSLAPLLKWWLEYESWIKENLGTEHRDTCYRQWSKIKTKVNWLPPESATEWVKGFLEQKDQMTRPDKLSRQATPKKTNAFKFNLASAS